MLRRGRDLLARGSSRCRLTICQSYLKKADGGRGIVVNSATLQSMHAGICQSVAEEISKAEMMGIRT